jgi:O-antigen/teichoic acid export membrane protein
MQFSSKLSNILNNAAWMSIEQVLRLFGSLLIGIWIARHLGPTEFGSYSFAIAFSSLIGIFSNLGLNRTLVRELSLNLSDKAFTQRIIATSISWRILISVACYVFAATLSIFFEQGRPLLIAIIALNIVFNSSEVFDIYFQSRTASRYAVIARSISFFVFLLIKILLLLNEGDIVDFAIVMSLESFGTALSLYLANKYFGIKLHFSDIDFRYGGRLIVKCWPELLAGFACLIFMRIDQIMLGNIIGDAAVGQYSIASRLAESWYFIPTALVASTFPALVIKRTSDKTLYLKRIQQLMLVLVLISYLVAFIVTLIAPWGIPFLFGPDYKNSSSILIVLIWSGLFVSLGTASGSWIVAEGKLMLSLTRNLIGAISNILFNLYLIPRYGALGAAYGTLISISIAYFFSDFLNKQTRQIGFLKLKSILLIWK